MQGLQRAVVLARLPGQGLRKHVASGHLPTYIGIVEGTALAWFPTMALHTPASHGGVLRQKLERTGRHPLNKVTRACLRGGLDGHFWWGFSRPQEPPVWGDLSVKIPFQLAFESTYTAGQKCENRNVQHDRREKGSSSGNLGERGFKSPRNSRMTVFTLRLVWPSMIVIIDHGEYIGGAQLKTGPHDGVWEATSYPLFLLRKCLESSNLDFDLTIGDDGLLRSWTAKRGLNNIRLSRS
ncbi:hypothetical protein PGT21_002773 [Puccinia graminis f. sp. tritici]|uniref:Uncharacterized protein n=1 Tax=Puccinia graminis f. sp. tritici TaxID=56615 RepID=A0A5B0LKZ2_PUCGR|nr:hypothetical protein PGT21_002773 [Puccinia graminis f. sp. tritici]KAA1079968.1 hypothetical protein PGTUg99_014846 [Puccinia graminis f. sp. tritici]